LRPRLRAGLALGSWMVWFGEASEAQLKARGVKRQGAQLAGLQGSMQAPTRSLRMLLSYSASQLAGSAGFKKRQLQVFAWRGMSDRDLLFVSSRDCMAEMIDCCFLMWKSTWQLHTDCLASRCGLGRQRLQNKLLHALLAYCSPAPLTPSCLLRTCSKRRTVSALRGQPGG
jgi:hypothetical protein